MQPLLCADIVYQSRLRDAAQRQAVARHFEQCFDGMKMPTPHLHNVSTYEKHLLVGRAVQPIPHFQKQLKHGQEVKMIK